MMVEPKRLYQPQALFFKWCTRWTMQCGNCEKDFQSVFAWFGAPKCPYCEIKNTTINIDYYMT